MKTVTKRNNIRKYSLLVFFIAQFLMIILPGCQNPFEPPVLETFPSGKGSFSLTINGVQTGRTILPTGFENFKFNLHFINLDDEIKSKHIEDQSYAGISGNRIYLYAGTYSLSVTAYNGQILVATANLSSIVIWSGNNTPRVIALKAIEDGYGTFSWTIDYPEGTEGSMVISYFRGQSEGDPVYFEGVEPIEILGENFYRYIDNLRLSAGYYEVTLTLTKTNDDGLPLHAVHNEILHIYNNLESHFDYTFYNSYFPNPITVTFDANGGSFASPPIVGDPITKKQANVAYGDFYYDFETPSAPMAGYYFDGWYTESKGGDKVELYANVTNPINHTLYAQWALKVSGSTGSTWADAIYKIISDYSGNEYVIRITESVTIPGSTPPDDGLTFGTRNGITVTIRGDYTTLSLQSGIKAFLLNIGENQTVIVENLALKGHENNEYPLIYVNGNVGEFIMDNGSSVSDNTNGDTSGSNQGGGVCVKNYGKFTMKGDSKVYNNIGPDGAGVHVGTNGNFYMEDNSTVFLNTSGSGVYVGTNGNFYMRGNSKVYENGNNDTNGGGVFSNGTFYMDNNSEVYGNTGYLGGGVHVNGGTFEIWGGYGTIRGNTALQGGGVYVARNGKFQKTGGTIYGAEEELDSYSYLKNTATETGTGDIPKGHAVYVDEYGSTFRPKRIRNTTAGDTTKLNSENDDDGNWE